jgi:hypothetical protein
MILSSHAFKPQVSAEPDSPFLGVTFARRACLTKTAERTENRSLTAVAGCEQTL